MSIFDNFRQNIANPFETIASSKKGYERMTGKSWYDVPAVGGGVKLGSLGAKVFGVGTGKTIATNIPWKPVAYAGGGLLAGWGISSLGKEKKQEQSQAQQQKVEQKQDMRPETSWNIGRDKDPFYDYRTTNQYDIIYGSPGASIYSEKKAEQGGSTPSWTQPMTFGQTAGASQGASQEATQSDMGSFLAPAIVLGVAVLGYGYLKGRKAK